MECACGQAVPESRGKFGVISKNARPKTCPLIYPQPTNMTVNHEPAFSFTFIVGLYR